MKIAVIGGTGLIGSAIVAHLLGRGHTVISMSRSPDPSSSDFRKVDISKATSPSYWLPHLNGIEAVVNCAAALPVTWVMPNTGQLQIVLLEDVVRTVAYFLDPGAPSRRIVELVGPQQHSFAEVVSLFRGWYRWPPAREIHLPEFASSMAYKLG